LIAEYLERAHQFERLAVNRRGVRVPIGVITD